MNTSSVTALALTLALGAAVAGAAIASPSPDSYTRSKVVRVADLDLSSEQGARTALKRIRGAAHYVCTDRSAHPNSAMWTSSTYRTCVRAALDGAISDLGNPVVASLYNGGKPVQLARK